MTTEELYKKLEDPNFHDNTDNIFTNVYIFPYDIKEENNILSEIKNFKNRLIRPSNSLDILNVDIFQLMCDYLESINFGKRGPFLEYFQAKEQEGKDMSEAITQTIYTHNDAFLQTLNDKINNFLSQNESKSDGLKRSIVMLYGFSKIYPYVRVNQLLSSFEGFKQKEHFKIVLCYPGEATDSSFSLFGILKDNHAYRAQILSEKSI